MRPSELNYIEATETLVGQIEEYANAALSDEGRKSLPPDELQSVLRARENFRPAFDELQKWFIDPISTERKIKGAYGYEKLWELMGAAFHIGAFAAVSKGACVLLAPDILREFENSTVEKMRAVRDKEYIVRNGELQKAVEHVATELKIKLTRGIKCADRLFPHVRKQLDLTSETKEKTTYPSASTI